MVGNMDFEHQRLHDQRWLRQCCRRRAERDTNNAYGFAGESLFRKGHRRLRVAAFEEAKGDSFANTFAVGLKVVEQDGIAGLRQEPCPLDEGGFGAVNAMLENDHAASGIRSDQPATEGCPAGAGKGNRLHRQVLRGRHRTIERRAINGPEDPRAGARSEEHAGNGSDAEPLPAALEESNH